MEKHSYPLEVASTLFPSVAHKTISNWGDRDLLFTDFEEPGRGRRREYSRENLIEIAIAINMIEAGFTREQTMQAFRQRSSSERAVGFAGDALAGLKEFRPGSKNYRWAVFCVARADTPKDRGYIASCKAFTEKDAAKLLELHADDAFTILPISHIVAQVDRALAEWDAQHEGDE